MNRFSIGCAALCGAVGLLTAAASAQEVKQETKSVSGQTKVSSVTQQQLNTADKSSTNFLLTNGNYAQTRFYPARQIDRDSVKKLHVAWIFQTDVKESLETSPIVVDGIMYVTTSFSHVYALDAKTGVPIDSFGEHGIVNLKTPEVMGNAPNYPYDQPAVPMIYKNLIITGAGTPDAAPNVGAEGDTRAWDARTGKLVWTFHTTPRPGEYGYDTWGGDSARHRSGVNVWGYFTVDAKRGILYMPLGAPNNDRVGVDRPGNNLFSSSIVAVDANTGKYLWHFQVTHHDIWDNDTQDPPVLMDVHKDGKTIPALLTVNKNALAFILDRVTGKPVFGVEERAVPQSHVPGEETSATQPYPVKPEQLSQGSVSRDNLYKGEPEHQAWCEKLVDDNHMVLGSTFLPPGYNEITVAPPGTQGGVNYYGGSYDPKLHLFVANVNNLFQPMRVVKRPDGTFANNYGVLRFWDPEKKLPCGPTPWGQLVAVNVDTGDVAWRKTLGVTDSFPPQFQDTGRPGLGGTILTASGLTFVGATDDFRFRAFATATGDKLWEVKLKASVTATPATYLGSDKRQYVAMSDTGGSQTGSVVTNDEVIAFALPKK